MFSAKLTGLKPKDVMHLISSLPAHVECKFAQTPGDAPAKANGKKNPGMKDCLKLGPNFAKARNETLNGNIVAILQTYESKHGAGSMRKHLLRDKLKPKSAAPEAAINLALKSGIIEGAS